MLAKVRCAQIYAGEAGVHFDQGGCHDLMAQSIFEDIKRNTGLAA
jgi:hypothetical protein